MTIPDALTTIDTLIKAWQVDEIASLRDGEAIQAHDCRIRISALEHLRRQLDDKAAA